MSAQPVERGEEDHPSDSLPVPTEELDAVELMWIERLSTPYVPTPSRPFRALRCEKVTKNGPRAGKRCGREAILGTTVCSVHGGQLTIVKEAAANRKTEAILRLVGLQDQLVDGLEDLAFNAVSEAVRLKAIETALGLGGLRSGTEINVTVEQVDTAAETVREKLETLRRRHVPDVIEGEIVENALEPETAEDTVEESTHSTTPLEETHE